jgi:acyl-CoA thioester hydrolase
MNDVRAPRPTRSDYRWWDLQTTRYADIDGYGHMNNARYFELMDTAVTNQLMEASRVDIDTLGAIGVVAEASCRYFREIGYPAPVDVGIVVDRIGRSSVIYRVGLFQGDADEASAEGRYVHVYVDNTDPARPSVPVPDAIRAAIQPLEVPHG